MMLESMIAAYTMSTMSVDGTRPSEPQMMASGASAERCLAWYCPMACDLPVSFDATLEIVCVCVCVCVCECASLAPHKQCLIGVHHQGNS